MRGLLAQLAVAAAAAAVAAAAKLRAGGCDVANRGRRARRPRDRLTATRPAQRVAGGASALASSVRELIPSLRKPRPRWLSTVLIER